MRRLFTALMVLCTAMALHAESVRIYCRMNYEWWTEDGAAIAAYAFSTDDVFNADWPGQRMTPVNDGLGTWYIDFETNYQNIIFVRVSSSGVPEDWGAKTEDLTFPTDDNRLYVITSDTATWTSGGMMVTGYWTQYNDDPNPGGGDPNTGNGYNIQTYNITFYAPNACPDMKPAITGDFNSWSDYVTMTSYTAEGEGSTYYGYSFQGQEGQKFRIGGSNDPENNKLQYYSDDAWHDYEDYILTSDPDIVLDHSSNASYRFSQCADGTTGDPTGGNGTGESEANYFLIGNSVELGSWEEDNAIPFTPADDLQLNLPAGTYAFKVMRYDKNWSNVMGYSNVGANCSSPNIASDIDENICVTLSSYGELNVSVSGEQVCVTGDFANTSSTVHLTTAVSPQESGAYIYRDPEFTEYTRGTTVELDAHISTGGWMFDRWSDNDSWDNPRNVYLDKDTSITAIFSPGEYGILVSGTRLFRGTFTERLEGSYIAQFLANVQINAGEYFQVINLFHSDNTRWSPQLEDGGMSGNFTRHDNYIQCKTTGCYDMYIKIHYGQSADVVYIGGGSDCPTGEEVDLGGGTATDRVYSLVGTDNLFTVAWNTGDSLTEMTRTGDGMYTYTIDSVTLVPGGSYEYKVIANHAWNVEEYPSIQEDDNYQITVEDAGVYQILFSFQPGTGCNASTIFLHELGGGGNTGEDVLYSTTFADWTSQSISSEQMLMYGDITFTAKNIKIVPNQQPSGINGASMGYIQPTNANSCYLQTGMIAYVSTVKYTQASTSAGKGWRLESSSDGVNWFAFNENDPGCETPYTAETREMNVFMENVWLRWAPTSANAGTNIYLTEITIFGTAGGSTGGDEPHILDSGTCAADGSANVTWLLSGDSILTIGGNGAMADYNQESEVPWYEYKEAYHSVYIASGVTNVGNQAFRQSPRLRYVNLESTVTSLGSYAFKGCTMLSSVVLPSSVTAIGTSAFEDCSALASVNIPDGITTLDMYTFSGCSSLRSIDLPSSVTSLGSYCFAECGAVDTIICRATTPPSANGSTFSGVSGTIPVLVPNASLQQYRSSDGWSSFSNLRSIEGGDPVCTPQSGTCGNEVTWALTCDSVLTISGVGDMDNYNTSYPSYKDYLGMVKIAVIESGVTSVGGDAFLNCETMEYATIAEGVTAIRDGAFYACTGLKRVIIPNTVDTIETQAFRSCAAMQYIDLPASVKYLGPWAFAYNSYIDSLICRAVVPPTLDGSDPLYEIPRSTPLYVPANAVAAYQATEGWSEFTNIIALPVCTIASGECGADGGNLTWVLTCDSVLTISGEGEMPSSYSSNATPWYSYGQAIKHINIEEGVTKLALNAFYNSGSSYPNVRTLSIPSTLGAPIETSYFYGCPFTSVTINSDTIVGKASYTSGSSLQNKFGAQVEEYIIGSNVRSIANFAFRNQSPDSLRSIILPEGLEAIGNWAFGYIEHLTSVTIPSTVQTIGTDAFAGCTNLRTIELGEGLTTINGQAFYLCDSLKYVISNALTPPTLNSTAFDHYDTLLVRCEAKTAYKQADYWKNFSLIICPDDTVYSAPSVMTFALDTTWTFIMLPSKFGLSTDDVTADAELSWARYNGSRRARGTSGWATTDISTGFMTDQAYIVRAMHGTATLTIQLPEQARAKAETSLSLMYFEATHEQNANWNFIGNPYPYSYNIMSALEAADIEAPIAVWNGTAYSLYTPGLDEFVLQPFQAFFIQLPDGGPTVLNLSADYIVE